MKDFTIHNFFKCWAKLLPWTIILAVIGLVCGLYYNSTIKQSYTAETEVLITGVPASVKTSDYEAIINNGELIVPAALDSTHLKDSECKINGEASGNVLTIFATCPKAEDAATLSVEAADVFSGTIAGIMHNENVFAQTISSRNASADVSTLSRIITIAVPVVAAFLLTAFIAFVKLDYTTSTKKTHKK